MISAALLLRFQLGHAGYKPPFQLAAEMPLGILFFIAAFAAAGVGIGGFFSLQGTCPMPRPGALLTGKVNSGAMQRQEGFIYSVGLSQRLIPQLC